MTMHECAILRDSLGDEVPREQWDISGYERIYDRVAQALDDAAERERALREEVERLRNSNQYLRDLVEAWEVGTIESSWKTENLRLRTIIANERENNKQLRDRVGILAAQIQRLRAFAEEMSWYAEDEWDDAAKRLLNYGDVQTIAEIRAANAREWARTKDPEHHDAASEPEAE